MVRLRTWMRSRFSVMGSGRAAEKGDMRCTDEVVAVVDVEDEVVGEFV